MTRREQLEKYIDADDVITKQFIDEFLYLENTLLELRDLPKIRVNPNNREQQKITPAAKLYKEYYQQYTNSVKLLKNITGHDEIEEESPLRKWANQKLTK